MMGLRRTRFAGVGLDFSCLLALLLLLLAGGDLPA